MSIDIESLARLADDGERRQYFASHPELRRGELVWQLCEEVGRTVRADLERAARLASTARWLSEELGDDASRARSLRAAANVRLYRRDYKGALELYQRAIAQFDALGADLEAAITRSSAIGSVSHLGRHREALEFARDARAVFTRLEDRLHLGRLEVNVGHIHARRDDFTRALERYRAAYEQLRQVGQPADVAITLRNIAVCHQDLNDFPNALAAYVEAREYCRRHALTHTGLEVEYNIAYLYFLRGEYAQALRLFDEARRDCEANGDHHHAALCDLDRAEIYLELNLAGEAVELAGRAYDGFRELGMEYEMAKALTYRGLACGRLGEEESSRELLGRARQMFSRQDNRVWTAMVDLYAAFGRYAAGRPDEAAPLAESAFASFIEAGIPSRTALCELLLARLALEEGAVETTEQLCLSALDRVIALGRPILELQAHLVHGQAMERSGDRTGALSAYRQAEAALERLRSQLGSDELKIAFGEGKQAVYEGLVAITLDDRDSAAGRRAAWQLVERAKSRSLADMLALGAAELRPVAAGQEGLAHQAQELRRELNWLNRQLAAEELAGHERSLDTIEALQRDRLRCEERLLSCQRRLQAADAELGSLQGAAVADVEAVSAVLPPDGALIEYYISRDELFAFLLYRDRLEVHELAAAREARELYEQLRFQLGKFRLGPEYVRQFGEFLLSGTVSLLWQLHDLLLAPVVRDLEASQLVIVPHGFLHHLPFHALHDGERFLIDRYPVSYAPSATVYRLCCLREAQPGDYSLVLGVPDERAPMILDEARTVASVLPDAQLLIGDDATPEAIRRWGSDCRIIHLATHGLYRKDNPMFSAIRLGSTHLSLLDLYGIRLKAELAVLSGCGTGLGTVRGADELVGLTRGLLYAGARAVMATLWDVNDESTARFMKLFYRNLLGGSQPAHALQSAQCELRESYPHPYFWAPFVLVGRPQAST